MKTIFSFFIFVLILIQAQPVAARSSLHLQTEKNVYSVKEKVYFDVTSALPQTQQFHVLSAQRLEGKKWHSVRTDVACSCKAVCKRKPFQVSSLESIRKKWDKKSSECQPVLPGTYRIVILGHWNTKTKRQHYQAVSNNFTIQ